MTLVERTTQIITSQSDDVCYNGHLVTTSFLLDMHAHNGCYRCSLMHESIYSNVSNRRDSPADQMRQSLLAMGMLMQFKQSPALLVDLHCSLSAQTPLIPCPTAFPSHQAHFLASQRACTATQALLRCLPTCSTNTKGMQLLLSTPLVCCTQAAIQTAIPQFQLMAQCNLKRHHAMTRQM